MMDQLWSYVMYLNNHANLHPQKNSTKWENAAKLFICALNTSDTQGQLVASVELSAVLTDDL